VQTGRCIIDEAVLLLQGGRRVTWLEAASRCPMHTNRPLCCDQCSRRLRWGANR